MQPNSAFHQSLRCLLRLKTTFVDSNTCQILKNLLPVTPLSTQWAVTYLFYQYVWENPLEYKGLNSEPACENVENMKPVQFCTGFMFFTFSETSDSKIELSLKHAL